MHMQLSSTFFFSLKKNHEIRSEKMNGIMSSPIMALIIAFVLNISAKRLEKKAKSSVTFK